MSRIDQAASVVLRWTMMLLCFTAIIALPRYIAAEDWRQALDLVLIAMMAGRLAWFERRMGER